MPLYIIHSKHTMFLLHNHTMQVEKNSILESFQKQCSETPWSRNKYGIPHRVSWYKNVMFISVNNSTLFARNPEALIYMNAITLDSFSAYLKLFAELLNTKGNIIRYWSVVKASWYHKRTEADHKTAFKEMLYKNMSTILHQIA